MKAIKIETEEKPCPFYNNPSLKIVSKQPCKYREICGIGEFATTETCTIDDEKYCTPGVLPKDKQRKKTEKCPILEAHNYSQKKCVCDILAIKHLLNEHGLPCNFDGECITAFADLNTRNLLLQFRGSEPQSIPPEVVKELKMIILKIALKHK